MPAPFLQLIMQWAPASALLLAPASAGLLAPSRNAPPMWRNVVHQVRIEQRMSIRITARPGAAQALAGFADPDGVSRPRLRERRMGKCLGNGMIGGMTLRSEDQLVFYLRDSRVVSATLERACRARDFYSGFYMVRNPDGKLCVNRDTLLSRNGMNCKVTQLRELVARRH